MSGSSSLGTGGDTAASSSSAMPPAYADLFPMPKQLKKLGVDKHFPDKKAKKQTKSPKRKGSKKKESKKKESKKKDSKKKNSKKKDSKKKATSPAKKTTSKKKHTGSGSDDGNPTLSIVARKGEGETDVLITIKTPSERGEERTPSDICCVIDISGSMGDSADIQDENGATERTGLSLLDVVKHSVRTVIEVLTPADRLSIVSFHSSAKVELKLTAMTPAGKKKANKALEALRPQSSTNLWDGLKAGLDQLRKESDSNHLQSLLLLTDGIPNVEPPRGHLPMLRKYMDKNATNCSIHTFGFGYGLNSELLYDLAVAGDGTYVFIPDSGFVGTSFVNLTSNILCTMARNVVLQLETSEGVSYCSTLGGLRSTETSWGATIGLGSLCYGQSRDVVVRMNVPSSAESYITATLCYETLGSSGAQRVGADGVDRKGGSELEVQALRAEFVDTVLTAVANNRKKGLPKVAGTVQDLIDRMRASSVSDDHRVEAMLEDLDGQVAEALSKKAWFVKWGEHYLRSLCRAHATQQCNNFKDPGVQVYGGSLFHTLRDQADEVFLSLPPPEPTIRARDASSGSGSDSDGYAYRKRSMENFYNVQRPCFDGSSLVRMADGSSKACKDVRRGDLVATLGKPAEVVCAVRTTCDNGYTSMVTLPGGLVVTPWHPICVANQWVFPAEVGTPSVRRCPAVFNFVLANEHVMLIGGVPCVTLGHGFKGDIREHAFFGTEKVVDALRSLPGFAAGTVHLRDGCCVRDPATGLICGLEM